MQLYALFWLSCIAGSTVNGMMQDAGRLQRRKPTNTLTKRGACMGKACFPPPSPQHRQDSVKQGGSNPQSSSPSQAHSTTPESHKAIEAQLPRFQSFRPGRPQSATPLPHSSTFGANSAISPSQLNWNQIINTPGATHNPFAHPKPQSPKSQHHKRGLLGPLIRRGNCIGKGCAKPSSNARSSTPPSTPRSGHTTSDDRRFSLGGQTHASAQGSARSSSSSFSQGPAARPGSAHSSPRSGPPGSKGSRGSQEFIRTPEKDEGPLIRLPQAMPLMSSTESFN